MSAQAASGQLDELTEELYREFKGLAATLRRQHRVGDTMNTTALVGEAYLKLRRSGHWESRDHFLRVAAHAIRQVLVDEARYWLANKRTGARTSIEFDESTDPGELGGDEFLIALDQSLSELATLNPRLAELVEYRYFAGFADNEIAELQGVTTRTVRRDWLKVKAWLYQSLGQDV